MTLSEKILRIMTIPERIKELERNRERLLEAKVPDIGDGAGKSSYGNTSEDKSIAYADDGKEADNLRQERAKLIFEVQDEIDSILVGDEIDDIHKRQIIKSRFLDNKNLKAISRRELHRHYGKVRELFHSACDELGIDDDLKRKYST